MFNSILNVFVSNLEPPATQRKFVCFAKSTKVLQKQKQRDAEENFWSWVTDLTQSSPSRSLGQPGPRVMTPGEWGFSSQSKIV